MELQTASGRLIRNVTEEEVRDYVLVEEYAILSTDEHTYMQCSGEADADDDYVLEYQDGGLDKHFCAVDERITGEQVVAALLKFLHGDESWRADFEWSKIDLS